MELQNFHSYFKLELKGLVSKMLYDIKEIQNIDDVYNRFMDLNDDLI